MGYRIVQWTTGNVARQAVPAVLDHPDLELVGCFAHSPEKVGRDVADLVGLAEPTGVVATDDVDALLRSAPDCVIYTPLHFDVGEASRILGAGVNVVTSAEFLSGRSLGAEDQATIEAAARAGGASIFGSGMNPGYVQLLAAVTAGISTNIGSIRVSESVDVSMFAGDGNMDELGWGRPRDDPRHADDLQRATLVFDDGLDVLAELMGVDLDERRCVVEFAYALHDLDLPGRPIAAGTVGGIDLRWQGVVAGSPVLELHQRWVMGRDLDPPMPAEHGYVVEVQGEPNLRVKLDIWPHQDLSSMGPDDFHGIGMAITALPVVNAIPAVVAAEPGIRTYAQLPVVTSSGRIVARTTQ